MFTGKGILQASVPLSVFGENFLYQLKGIQKVGAAFQLYDRTAWMDTGDINTSHSDKINIPVIEERLIHIRTLKQVNIPGIQFFSLFVEAYTFQAGTVILGIEGDILGVYSPLGRTGKTSYALALGQILAVRYSVLFLNLEAYSGFEDLLSCSFERNLGDLFYCIRQKKGQPAVQLAAMVREAGGMQYVPPVTIPEDVEQVTQEEWQVLFEELRLVL